MRLIKESAIYLGSSILNKMIPFFLLPILTSKLSVEEYGLLSIFLIVIQFYSAFMCMSIHTNITKNFFLISKKEMASYIGNMFIILSVSFLFYLLLTLVVTLTTETFFSIPSKLFLLIPFISLFLMFNDINTTILRNERKVIQFGLFQITNTALKMGLTILFLLFFSLNWLSQVYATFLSSLLFFIICIVYAKRNDYLILQFDKVKFKSIIQISIPLIPHVLGSVVIALSDRFFIEKMVSLEAVGIYSVGYMFGMIIMLFTDAFVKAWGPWFYKILSNPTNNDKKQVVKYTYLYLIGIVVLSVVVSTVSNFILPYFIDDKFYGAKDFIVWITLGYAIQGIYKIFFPYLVLLNKTSFLAVSTIVAAIINLLFNYLLINICGTIGAAYSTIIAFSVSSILVFMYQRKRYSMPWSLSKWALKK